MPTNFKCNGCDLSFSIGWYHHHNAQSGLRASTLAVCAQCGAQHSLEPARDFSQQACGHCSTVGSLITDEKQPPSACPQCGSPIAQVASWIT